MWFDLVTSDPVAAAKFYTALIGWGTMDWAGGDQPYTMWTMNETPVGGMVTMATDPNAGSFWHGYVSTADTDATVKQAKAIGGKVFLQPKDIPTVGRFAVMGDPQGAVFAPFTPLPTATPPADGPPPVGGFSWHELATSDLDAGFGFYKTLFGWEPTNAYDMGPLGIYQMFGYEGAAAVGPSAMVGGIYRKPAGIPGPGAYWLHYIRVPSVDDAAAKIPTLGGKVTQGPMEVPGGSRVLQGVDPQGAAFALHTTAKR